MNDLKSYIIKKNKNVIPLILKILDQYAFLNIDK
jgi:hypothetical protein